MHQSGATEGGGGRGAGADVDAEIDAAVDADGAASVTAVGALPLRG